MQISYIMKMIIGVLLVVAGIWIGYAGVNQIQDSSASVNILGINIEANDNAGKEKGYLFLGLGVLLLGSGVYTITNSRNS